MWCSWGIESNKWFHIFVKSLSYLGNYIWLISLDVHQLPFFWHVFWCHFVGLVIDVLKRIIIVLYIQFIEFLYDVFCIWLVPAQHVHFFYTRSNFSALQNCVLILLANFQFIFTFKKCTTQFNNELCSALKYLKNIPRLFIKFTYSLAI